jgi:hypothetical protein
METTVLCHLHARIVYKCVTPRKYTSPSWFESERNMVRFRALFLRPPVTDTSTLGARQSQMHLARPGDPLYIPLHSTYEAWELRYIIYECQKLVRCTRNVCACALYIMLYSNPYFTLCI